MQKRSDILGQFMADMDKVGKMEELSELFFQRSEEIDVRIEQLASKKSQKNLKERLLKKREDLKAMIEEIKNAPKAEEIIKAYVASTEEGMAMIISEFDQQVEQENQKINAKILEFEQKMLEKINNIPKPTKDNQKEVDEMKKKLEEIKKEMKRLESVGGAVWGGSDVEVRDEGNVLGPVNKINFVGGSVTVTREGAVATVTITAESGGGTWGSITGTLSDQEDLQAALDAIDSNISAVSSSANIFNIRSFI